jgi:hypothetical protein
MEKNNFLEMKGICPEDTNKSMNKTLGSKQWCEPRKDKENLAVPVQESKIIKDF